MSADKNSIDYWLALFYSEPVREFKGAIYQKGDKVYLGDKISEVYFSRRESECVYQLLQGHRPKKIAQMLSLSVKTVEQYIYVARRKLGSPRMGHFIHLVMNSDFLKNFKEINKPSDEI